MSGDANPAMSCQQVVELVTDYLEGALDEAASAEVVAHLALCPGCATYLDQMRATIEALGHVPVDTLSERAQAELVAAFRDVTRRSMPPRC